MGTYEFFGEMEQSGALWSRYLVRLKELGFTPSRLDTLQGRSEYLPWDSERPGVFADIVLYPLYVAH